MPALFITTAQLLDEGLTRWIITHRNPTTPKDWIECLNDLRREGYVDFLGAIEDQDVDCFKDYCAALGAGKSQGEEKK